MPREKNRPTESELQILAVLWELGPCTVRQVHERLGWDTGYTTVLKFMQLMTDKGLLARQKKGKLHIYRSAASPERMQKDLVGDLLERAFGGSLSKLVVAALSAERASAKELEEIRKLIEGVESQRTEVRSQRPEVRRPTSDL